MPRAGPSAKIYFVEGRLFAEGQALGKGFFAERSWDWPGKDPFAECPRCSPRQTQKPSAKRTSPVVRRRRKWSCESPAISAPTQASECHACPQSRSTSFVATSYCFVFLYLIDFTLHRFHLMQVRFFFIYINSADVILNSPYLLSKSYS